MNKSVQRPEKPKTPAQRASEANRQQQVAIRDRMARPNDRQQSNDKPAVDEG